MNNGQHNYNNWHKMRNVAYTVKGIISFFLFLKKCIVLLSKKEGKDQESVQSSTTPDPGYQCESQFFA